MIDKDKVIRGLEICSELGSWHGLDCRDNDAYKDCPYRNCETGCVVTIAKDAITLLKTQPQIIECKDYKRDYEWASVYESKINKCVCGHEINRYWHPKYCGFCGMRLEWR